MTCETWAAAESILGGRYWSIKGYIPPTYGVKGVGGWYLLPLKLNATATSFSRLIRMPFEPITHTKLKRDGNPISKGSIKIYTKLLNRLAEGDFDTIHKLKIYPTEVLDLIDTVVDGDDDKQRAEKRQYLSAIFYALDTQPLGQKTAYYDYFQTIKQNYQKMLMI